jgi:hypothetical protein
VRLTTASLFDSGVPCEPIAAFASRARPAVLAARPQDGFGDAARRTELLALLGDCLAVCELERDGRPEVSG